MSVVSLLVAARLVQGWSLHITCELQVGNFAVTGGDNSLHRLVDNMSLGSGVRLSSKNVPVREHNRLRDSFTPNVPVREFFGRKRVVALLVFPYGLFLGSL